MSSPRIPFATTTSNLSFFTILTTRTRGRGLCCLPFSPVCTFPFSQATAGIGVIISFPVVAPGGNALQDEIDTADGRRTQERGTKSAQIAPFSSSRRERGSFHPCRKELSTLLDEWSSSDGKWETGHGKIGPTLSACLRHCLAVTNSPTVIILRMTKRNQRREEERAKRFSKNG